MEDLNIRMITWNVNGQYPYPGLDISDILGTSESLYDFLLVGFQEVNSMPQSYVYDYVFTGEDPWTQAFRSRLLVKGYIKVQTIRTVGIILTLFALKKHLLFLRDVETQYTKLSFGGYWGSKGAVSIRLNVYGVSICFLNCHLPPHDENLQARIDSYESIIENHLYKHKDTPNILYHDYIFWEGDLNFRLLENSFNYDEIVMLIRREQLEILHRHDQLAECQSSGKVDEVREGMEPPFPPTYKFKVGAQEYDPKRRPAYTDRILHRVNKYNYEDVKLNADQLNYDSHPKYTCSDHKPVTADFRIRVFSRLSAAERQISNYDPIINFRTPEKWIIGRDGVISYTVSAGNGPNDLGSWDWIALFKSGFNSLQDFVTFTWASNCKLTGVVKTAVIMDSAINTPGDYVLVYITASKSVVGMSRPFPIVHEFATSVDVAEEATEETIEKLISHTEEL